MIVNFFHMLSEFDKVGKVCVVTSRALQGFVSHIFNVDRKLFKVWEESLTDLATAGAFLVLFCSVVVLKS